MQLNKSLVGSSITDGHGATTMTWCHILNDHTLKAVENAGYIQKI